MVKEVPHGLPRLKGVHSRDLERFGMMEHKSMTIPMGANLEKLSDSASDSY